MHAPIRHPIQNRVIARHALLAHDSYQPSEDKTSKLVCTNRPERSSNVDFCPSDLLGWGVTRTRAREIVGADRALGLPLWHSQTGRHVAKAGIASNTRARLDCALLLWLRFLQLAIERLTVNLENCCRLRFIAVNRSQHHAHVLPLQFFKTAPLRHGLIEIVPDVLIGSGDS